MSGFFTRDLSEMARAIVDDPAKFQPDSPKYAAMWADTAQAYLDAVSEGFDGPEDREELLALLAEEEAHDTLPRGPVFSGGGSDSYEEGPYSASEWFALNRDQLIASIAREFEQVAA